MSTPHERTVFITAANHGAGLALATTLASLPNYHILMGTRSLARGAETLQRIAASSPSARRRISLIEIDISSDASVAAAATTIATQHGAIDILVNNAGVFPDSSSAAARTSSTPKKSADLRARLAQAFEVNVLGSTLVTETCLPLLRQSRDARRQIIFLSSALGGHALAAESEALLGDDDGPACTCVPASQSQLVHGYSVLTRLARQDESSKAALSMIMQCYGIKLQSEGVRVNAVSTGAGTKFGRLEDGVGRLMELITGDRRDIGAFNGRDGSRPW